MAAEEAKEEATAAVEGVKEEVATVVVAATGAVATGEAATGEVAKVVDMGVAAVAREEEAVVTAVTKADRNRKENGEQ